MWPVALFALMIDAKLAAIVCAKRFNKRRQFIRNVNRVRVCVRASYVCYSSGESFYRVRAIRFCFAFVCREIGVTASIQISADFELAEIENAARRYDGKLVCHCVSAGNRLSRPQCTILFRLLAVHTRQSSRSSSECCTMQ